MDLKHTKGQTERRVISHSPLHDNQNWLFDLLYDRAVLEVQTRNVNLPVADGGAMIPLPVFLGYSGAATTTYNIALEIFQVVMRNPGIRFGIGGRSNRAVSVMSAEGSHSTQLVPNIF